MGNGLDFAIALHRTRQVFLDLSVDLRVLGFTAGVAIATGLLFGLAPAWRGSRVSPQAAMKQNSRAARQGRSSFLLGNALVMAQVACRSP